VRQEVDVRVFHLYKSYKTFVHAAIEMF
jgi:hypothetical protein